MAKFKEGDKVTIIGHHWVDGSEVEDLQYIIGRHGIISEISSDSYYNVRIEGEARDWGILPSDLELYNDEPLVAHFVPEVKIVKTIQVKQDGLIVQHAVNSKKQRIVISKNIKIDDLDTLIVMLKQLKEEVAKE